ncbi:MAG TPA: hypothetical protein VEC57_15135, partial [Candidatus Limnocylindrales bacterium]|nr:hypothetical protein [Candidatus Limnocylindrales bacterium]
KVQELQRIIDTDAVKGERDVQLAQLKAHLELGLQQLKGEQALEQLREKGAIADRDREDSQAHELGMHAADAAQAVSQAERAAALRPMPGPAGAGL